ncbi:MAG: NYN domain-containing protein [Phycisphaerae bacterium]
MDGNNLMHALAAVGADCSQSALCRMLGCLAEQGEGVSVVFDGRAPNPSLAAQLEDVRVRTLYGGSREADTVILELIAADTAPRRLTVVSTDREIRAAARKRRCCVVTSEEFVPVLLKATRQRPPPAEPPEKRRGLTPEQTRKWLREFGFEE